jgi:predicted dehydrogenase
MERIRWGIIGCGDVTEIKSGPGFQKADNSQLIAVMRRNGRLAEDYAKRHNVPTWYDNADELIDDPEVNAVYIATPPAFHAEYTKKVAAAGKPVYVEKPMALDYASCLEMIEVCKKAGVPLFVAYYRRMLPHFLKVKQLVESGTIGEVRYVTVQFCRPPQPADVDPESTSWRLDRNIGGGGYFIDMGTHQLDYLDYLFGPVQKVDGFALNQAGLYPVEDIVTASLLFDGGIIANGVWSFATGPAVETDRSEIIGTKGKIAFTSFTMTPVVCTTEAETEKFDFKVPEHVQQPLIQTVVDELLGRGESPSTGESGARTNWVADQLLNAYYDKKAEG